MNVCADCLDMFVSFRTLPANISEAPCLCATIRPGQRRHRLLSSWTHGSFRDSSTHDNTRFWFWTLDIHASKKQTLEMGSAGAARCTSGNVCASGKLWRHEVSRQHVARKAHCTEVRWLVIIDTQTERHVKINLYNNNSIHSYHHARISLTTITSRRPRTLPPLLHTSAH